MKRTSPKRGGVPIKLPIVDYGRRPFSLHMLRESKTPFKCVHELQYCRTFGYVDDTFARRLPRMLSMHFQTSV
jgi:hypothetical protein